MFEWASQGWSQSEMCVEMNITRDIWNRWVREDEHFKQVANIAKERQESFFTQLGRKHLVEEKDEAKLNNTNYIFQMKNRFGWGDGPKEDKSDYKPPVLIVPENEAKRLKMLGKDDEEVEAED